MNSQKLNGGQAVMETLAARGVDLIFGIPGGHSLGLYDALAGQTKIRHVLGRHEQGLGFMADGYARTSGRIGVLTTTSGPAVANLACSLGQATTDTSPVLAIASTVRSNLVGKNRGGLHDLNRAEDLMRSVCRYVHSCRSVEEIPWALSDLIYRLRTGRPGGAFCEIPCDILGTVAQVEIPAPRTEQKRSPDPAAIKAATDLLAKAQRPILWIGTGATLAGAGAEVKTLAEEMGAVVIHTILGRGLLPADHPNVVMIDGATWSGVNDLVGEADVVLAVGTMFKQEDTADWKTKLGQTLIHIDLDPEEIGRSYTPAVGIVADAKLALQAILAALPQRTPAPAEWVRRGKEAEAARLASRRKQGPTDMRVLDIFRAAVPRDAITICDRCSLGYWAFRCMPAYAPRTFQYPLGYGGLGGALPQSIGAKLACPEKQVVCVIGDGGFQFTATELAVAVQEHTAVTIVLCNNRGYGAIRANQDRHFGGRRFGSDLVNPDFIKFAGAYGIPAVTADSPEQFEQALKNALNSNQLNLIELTAPLMDP